MKKFYLIGVSVFILSSISFAAPRPKPIIVSDPLAYSEAGSSTSCGEFL